MKANKPTKYGFYMLSMAVFFVVIFILGTDIPICFEKGAEFVGLCACLTTPGIVIPIICLVAFAIIWCFTRTLKRRIEGTTLGPITVNHVDNVNNDIMAFVGSYFLPIVSFNIAEKWQHFLVLIILFVLIGIIYVKADIYYANPTLLIFGYRVYKVNATKLGKELECVIIIRDTLKSGDKLMYIPIDDHTFYAKNI